MKNSIEKVRDSNMELFRIVCMLLVILFHVYGIVDVINNDIPTDNNFVFINLIAVSATFICVDSFVLLSGWYGINTKASKLKSLIFQVLFYSIISYIIFTSIFDDIHYSINFIIHIFILDDYWFVPTYLLLYIFAPVINEFIKNSSQKKFKYILIFIITAQCIYGWLNTREAGYLEGRSPFSFIILYILARYLRLYPVRIKKLNRKYLLILYITSTLINTVIAYEAKIHNMQTVTNIVFQFSSPLIIFNSVCLLLLFSKIEINYNKTINLIAASSFSVFLIHCFPYFIDKVFIPFVKYLYLSYHAGLFIVYSICFVIVIYVCSILIDQIRIYVYHAINKLFSKG